jgi:ABC-type dipeptide/oligopeptide/nickel transport system permease component
VLAFLLRRLLEAVPVVFLTTVAIFVGIRLIPGDPALDPRRINR